MSIDYSDNPISERTEDDPQTEAMVQLAKLWASAMPAIEAFVGSAVRDPNDRDDVIQATSEYLARNFENYELGTSFTGWAVQVARFRVMELFRDQSRNKLMLTGDALEAIAKVAPQLSKEQTDRAEALDQCMNHLGENQRRLLEMRYTQSLSPATIAERMGKSSNTISAALLRIRKALRTCIEERLSATEARGVGKR
ncbi:MAG: sigma-70 family RNA polymerase sigma factor [Phycisphaeraceae bacterium]